MDERGRGECRRHDGQDEEDRGEKRTHADAADRVDDR